jgi:DNA-binding beta-propeller fold protein YncE/putative cell wall-binding protein
MHRTFSRLAAVLACAAALLLAPVAHAHAAIPYPNGDTYAFDHHVSNIGDLWFSSTLGGASVGPDGLLYVADENQKRVQVYTRQLRFVRQWKIDSDYYTRPWSVSVTQDGNVYVADYGRARILKYDLNGNLLASWDTVSEGGGLFPGRAIDATNGAVYIAGDSTVLKYSPSGERLAQWTSPELNWAIGLKIGPDGTLYIPDPNREQIERFTPTGSLVATYASGSSAVAVDAGGTVWSGGKKMSPDGTQIGSYSFGKSEMGLATAADGSLFAVGGFDDIAAFSADGTLTANWTMDLNGTSQLSEPEHVTVVNGLLYVADTSNARVVVQKPNGDVVRSFGCPGAYDVAGDASGDVYVLGAGTIYRYSAEGSMTASWGSQADGPEGIGVSADGSRVYVADFGGNRVNAFSGTGTYLFSWGTAGAGAGQFNLPADVAVGPYGDVFVADNGNGRVQRFSEDGEFLGYFGNGVMTTPKGIAVDSHGIVNVADTYGFQVRRYTSSGVDLGSFPTGLGATGIDVDANGTIYLSFWNDHMVQAWSPQAVQRPETWRGTTRVYDAVAYPTRYTTSLAVSRAQFPRGARVVVIATGQNWPDAICASPLAAAAQGPLLLVPPSGVTADLSKELRRLGAQHAIVVGGSAAVPTSTLEALLDVPGLQDAVRVSGADRYQTSLEIADVLKLLQPHPAAAFLVTGANFPDALGASAPAAALGAPILLTPPTGLRTDVRSALVRSGAPKLLVVGGTAALPSGIETSLRSAVGTGTVSRLYSETQANRYGTCAAVAEYAARNFGMTVSNVGLASGEAFPDALVAGVAQGRANRIELLVQPNAVPAATANYLRSLKGWTSALTVYGGYAAVTDNAVLSAKDAATK